MADNTKLQYIVELLTQGDTKKATEELNKLNKAGSDGAKSVGLLQDGFAKLAATLGGMAFLKQSVDSFLEAERSVAKLNAALNSTNQFTPETSAQLQELAGQLAKVSTFGDDAILNVIARLTAMGAKAKDVERLSKAVLDLSTLMDRDLNRATLAMSAAISGRGVDAFRALGFAIDETLLPSEQFNELLIQIEKKAGGQAAAAVKTLGGNFEQLTKSIGEVKESLGGVILQTLDPMIIKLTKIADLIASFGNTNRSTIASSLNTASKMVGVMTGTGLSSLIPDFIGGSKPANPIADLGPEATATLQNFFAAGAQASAPQKPQVSTPGLSDEDLKERIAKLDEVYAFEDSLIEQINKQYEDSAALRIRQDNEAFENYRNAERMKQDLHDQIVLTVLDGEARVQAEMEINHQRRVQQIQDTKFETEEQYMEAMTHEEALYLAEQQRYNQSQTYSFKLKQDMMQVAESGAQAFSSGLAGAIVSAFEEGDKAFQKFAANFLRQIAEMILQALILRAVKSAIGLADGGQVAAMANGGMIYAANGVAGVNSVNSATYFPKFNVLAGEAGREVMTVLSRPRFERINGVPAQIGYAGGNRLAITSADALARGGGGGGGLLRIEVSYSKDAEARITENSVQNARVAVVQDMAQDSQLSRVTRQKMA